LATQGGLTAVRYILLTPRGLEGIACREVKEVDAAAAILDQGRGAVLVEAGRDPQPLMELHSIDDLYAEVLLLDDLDPRGNPLGQPRPWHGAHRTDAPAGWAYVWWRRALPAGPGRSGTSRPPYRPASPMGWCARQVRWPGRSCWTPSVAPAPSWSSAAWPRPP